MIELAAWSALLGAGDLLALDDGFEEELRIRIVQRAQYLDTKRAEYWGVAFANAMVRARL